MAYLGNWHGSQEFFDAHVGIVAHAETPPALVEESKGRQSPSGTVPSS